MDVVKNIDSVGKAVKTLRGAGIFVSIFIDPVMDRIEAAHRIGAQQVELCTGEYAELTLGATAAHGEGAMNAAQEVPRVHNAAVHAHGLGLKVAAGHGLTYRNVGALAEISEITEFNIEHNIISRSVFVGLYRAVEEMKDAIK